MKSMIQMNLISFSIIFFVSVIILSHFFIPSGYIWMKNTVSDLAAQNYDNAWIMRSGFIGFGILLNLGLLLKFIHSSKIDYADILIMIYGISILLSGFFSTAPFDASTNYSITQDKLHSMFAQIAGIAFTIGILGYIVFSTSNKEKLFHSIFLVLVIGIVALFGLSKNGLLSNYSGIIQRSLYLVSFIWMWIVYS